MAGRESSGRPRVTIIGGGFGGLTCARALGEVPVDVTIVDRCNYHLFQPLLYQVAMAGLSPAEIAVPIRSVVAREQAAVVLGEVLAIDVRAHEVRLADGATLGFDYLVVAAGAETNYFGNDAWGEHAIGMKRLEDALEIRRRVLLAFERAERLGDREARRRELTFVIIGGGPTGVELAGALAELAKRVLAKDFRNIAADEPRVVLVEGDDRVLMPFLPGLSQAAARALQELGVEVRLERRVSRIEPGRVVLGTEVIEAPCVIWAAGVRPTRLAAALPAEHDRQGRVIVGADGSLAGHPEVFVIGDMAHQVDKAGRPLPGLAPVAMQQGRHVARMIRADLSGSSREPFRYVDKGIMATIGRSRAVLQSGRVHMAGFWAWVAWIFIHILYLIGFRNRLFVLLDWCWSYVTYKRGSRLITEARPSELKADGGAAAAPRT